MIIRNNESWFKMLFVWKGTVLPKILPRLLILLFVSICVVYFKGKLFHYKIPLNPAPFTLFGIALALFLGFRNTTSYDRYWEARKLWGALLNDTRSLARQALTISGYAPESDEVTTFINYLIAFTYALKHQLRKTDPGADLQKRLSPELCNELKDVIYKPVILMREMSAWVQRAGTHAILRASFDQNLDKLSEVVGGCERIASTPIPFSYRVLLHRTVYFYCFLLPFGFVDSLGWLTPVIVVFIAYTFIALEAVADEIEEPFGTEANDLALSAMSLMIETTLLEMAGKPLPKQTKVRNYTVD
jgi:putative membrane protein